MNAQKRWTGILLTLLLLSGSSAWAEAPSDPVIKFDNKSDIELDLAVMTEDLVPLLIEAMEADGDDDVEEVKMLVDMFGLMALDKLHLESESTKKGGTSKVVLTLDTDEDTGLLGELFSIPQGECGFAKYLDKDELTLAVSIQNFAGHLDLLFDLLGRPEFAELTAEMPFNADGELEINGFNPQRQLLPLLSGELDIVLGDLPESDQFNPMALPVALVLGSEDGAALRDLILELMTLFAGDQGAGMAEMIRSLEPEQVGDFEVVATPFGGAYAVSEDYFVLGVSGESLGALLAEAKGDLRVPKGRTWMYMNGEKYGRTMAGVMDLAEGMGAGYGDSDLEKKWMDLMYSNLFDHLESETVRTTSREDRLVVEMDVQGSVMAGMYGMLRSFALELPALIEQQHSQSASYDVVGELDSAFTQYGVDHGGLFPADPHELVGEGYLEEFPLEVETAPGAYVDGAYTYHALKDEEGRIVGYYFFVYGGGEGTGWDVYTDENIGLGDDFIVGSDGIKDGVASFCYDGIALQQMADRK